VLVSCPVGSIPNEKDERIAAKIRETLSYYPPYHRSITALDLGPATHFTPCYSIYLWLMVGISSILHVISLSDFKHGYASHGTKHGIRVYICVYSVVFVSLYRQGAFVNP
jgi:hypothetical protein